MKKFTLLLPSCINTNNCSFLKRSDPKDREKDHFNAMKKWLEATNFDIVFVENSNADLSFLNPLIDNFKERIETLVYDGNHYHRGFGKGHGELLAINYAIDHSEKLKSETFIHKVAGRYYLTKIKELLETVENQKGFDNLEILAYYYHATPTNRVLPSVYFGMNKEKYNQTMRNMCINDEHGFYFEHALFNSMLQCDPEKILFFEEMGLEKDQYSGTGNHIIEHLK